MVLLVPAALKVRVYVPPLEPLVSSHLYVTLPDPLAVIVPAKLVVRLFEAQVFDTLAPVALKTRN